MCLCVCEGGNNGWDPLSIMGLLVVMKSGSVISVCRLDLFGQCGVQNLPPLSKI